ncbi:unnamed protein product [Amoebophrya sp. A25]|nr:unnamed protein product [Amoebophrya sp. A25]|eukprot:GSA25T00025955001.1
MRFRDIITINHPNEIAKLVQWLSGSPWFREVVTSSVRILLAPFKAPDHTLAIFSEYEKLPFSCIIGAG